MAYQNGPKKFQKHLAAKLAASTLAERVDAQLAAMSAPPERDTTPTVRPPAREVPARRHLFTLRSHGQSIRESLAELEAAGGVL